MRGKREMTAKIFLFTSPYHHIIVTTEKKRKSRQINKVNDRKSSIIRFYTVVSNSLYSTDLVQFCVDILLIISTNMP